MNFFIRKDIKTELNTSGARIKNTHLLNPVLNKSYVPDRYPVDKFMPNITRIEKKFVHKHRSNNIVISKPCVLSKENLIFRSLLITPFDNLFFFDHEYDHIPGMLALEAIRQLGTAISHLYLDVPFETNFILHNFITNFYSYINIDIKAYVDLIIVILKEKRDFPRKLIGTGYIHQNDKILCDMTSEWSILKKRKIF